MTTTVLAAYQDGVLRPTQPQPFMDGETVEITLRPAEGPPPAQAENDDVARICAARNLDEWITAANAPLDIENDYDLLAALEDNRRLSGDSRPLFGNGSE